MISIIIPVYNEEAQLPRLLQHIQEFSSNNITEIIVVDGGSTDATKEIVRKTPAVRFIYSEKGRAKQMNAGAAAATSKILYFLHADSFPPLHFDSAIVNQVGTGNKAGCFRMKFDKNHWWLNLMGWFTTINHKACRGGDQSLFITKELFNEIGGFDEIYIVFEDNDLIGKLYKRKSFTIIPKWLTTSARRYEKVGIWKLQYFFALLYLKKMKGATPEELYQYYKKKLS
ncbi:TIGR04283 family arsenosugar biosynthesis glycosyltransferase [Gillisia sp. M10.2A]|uniref:TIGR04283 family arsenosugar biosynthesis glycosyltransferase n=1 Tax=Gillisia lutea TaxID=2909668 RepID=A0ABS9ED75_9FLAO|nr:TIGR04283 family arsenosugar biosynthesis glycosyltransferase [Gillisia lutea]MCF4100836.1 TIGR04283 family arsenosugar biosynthesis glycosyltransferase [Gillisia lutea]